MSSFAPFRIPQLGHQTVSSFLYYLNFFPRLWLLVIIIFSWGWETVNIWIFLCFYKHVTETLGECKSRLLLENLFKKKQGSFLHTSIFIYSQPLVSMGSVIMFQQTVLVEPVDREGQLYYSTLYKKLEQLPVFWYWEYWNQFPTHSEGELYFILLHTLYCPSESYDYWRSVFII